MVRILSRLEIRVDEHTHTRRLIQGCKTTHGHDSLRQNLRTQNQDDFLSAYFAGFLTKSGLHSSQQKA